MHDGHVCGDTDKVYIGCTYGAVAAGARVDSNGASSSSASGQKQNGRQSVSTPRSKTAPVDPRFQGAVGRESPGVAQVALDPAATPLMDLNAATFGDGSPNRIRLADLILNDGKATSSSRSTRTCATGYLRAATILIIPRQSLAIWLAHSLHSCSKQSAPDKVPRLILQMLVCRRSAALFTISLCACVTLCDAMRKQAASLLTLLAIL